MRALLHRDPTAAAPASVVMVIEALALGGMESVAISLAAELQTQGTRTEVVVPTDAAYNPLAARLHELGVQHHRIQTSPELGFVARCRGTWQFIRLLRRERPAVVHLHCGGAYGGATVALAAALVGVPIIVTEHTPPAPRTRLARVLRAPLERSASAMVAVSTANGRLRRDNRGFVRVERLAVVVNGIPAVPTTLAAEWRAKTRVQWSAGDTIIIGCASQLNPAKRVADVLEAVALVDRSLPWRLVVAGDGVEREQLEALAESLGISSRVDFLGQLPDARPVIAGMDIFVLAQAEGSLSTAVLEAMNLGVVAVISHGGPDEPVQDGLTGRWAKPRDISDLAAVLESLLRDEPQRTRLAKRARQHVEEHYTVARMAEEYAALYRRASGDRRTVAGEEEIVEASPMQGRDSGASLRDWFISGVRWRLHIGRPRPQLLMRYTRAQPPPVPSLPEGITLRAYRPGDDDAWLELLQRNGELGEWDRARLDAENVTIVPEGVVFACDGERLVATSGVHDRPFRGEPAWEIGWVARDPEYARLGLGEAVTAASVAAALKMPQRPIFLKTDEHRHPAIKVYRKLGFVRVANTRARRRQWHRVAREMGM